MSSLFDLPKGIQEASSAEFFEHLLSDGKGMRVERIVSWGHVTPEGEWYDQEYDEWVVVVEGEARLGFADGTECALGRGEHIFLGRHVRHRVIHTSRPCVWLAVHAPELKPE